MATLERVGIVFAGGPAPAANAVIAVAASSFRRRGVEVVGILHGYGALEQDRPIELRAGEHYRVIEDRDLWGLRNSRGILIGTGRSNPGRGIRTLEDLDDPEKSRPLRNVYESLLDLGIDGLVSIGGDGTLKTANFLYELGRRKLEGARRIRIAHVPKTIDNDYRGIDFTFGFFTAVGVIAEELSNLRADALATNAYFIVETMGRSAGWIAYAAAIAGEAHLVVGVEDVVGELAREESVEDPVTGVARTEKRLDVDALVERVVDLILTRERRKKRYGTVVLSEGLAEMLPEKQLAALRDESGYVPLSRLDVAKLVAARVAERYKTRTSRSKKITGVQLGYESRSAAPHAFDVILGSQLGLGAYRALAEEGLDGHMVSVTGQLELRYVPFGELVDPHTLITHVRFVDPKSDFRRLAEELGTRIEKQR
ncbi:MAG TPA: 6-phosphofructokinase [Polyangiaceae bacterium]|jgi:6-phosphofructokinase 1|nr:6-phosphofructokinase [Polyangiaceae bacterium]